jgi:hypothetical protein
MIQDARSHEIKWLWVFLFQRGHAVVQLVEALRHKREGHGFDSRRCHWNFSLMLSFRPHYGPVVNSASNRNEYQEDFLGGKGGQSVGLTTLPPSRCRLSWNLGASTSWNPQGLSRPVMGLLYFYLNFISEPKTCVSKSSIKFIAANYTHGNLFLICTKMFMNTGEK